MSLQQIGAGIKALRASQTDLAERIDYLTAAVGRGDPRWCIAEYARRDVDHAAFDAKWIALGKRLPSAAEILGDDRS